MLDTTQEVEIPEGITLSLPVAGFISRALAFLIDFIIRALIVYITIMIFSLFGEFGSGLILLTMFLIEWFYPVLFEVFYYGQTPGKKVLGILVINDDGTPVDWSSSIVRNLLRFADFLPVFYCLGIVSMMSSKQFKRLGDFAAGTLVIHQRTNDDFKLEIPLDGLAPKTQLSLDEQSAIIGFAERSTKMSHPRLNELAGHLAPWLDQQKIKTQTESAAVQLTRIAKWLRGHS